MNKFWIEELRTKCKEIIADNQNLEMVMKVIEAYDCILRFANIGRKEGVLALEEASVELNMNDESQALFGWMIRLVVDGTNPEIIRTIGENRCIVMNLPSYRGLMNLMYIEGALMIQRGDHPRIMSEVMRSMMPTVILDELIRRERENTLTEKTKQEEDMVKALCKDDKEIDEKDHSIVSETARTLIMLSDMDVQRLFRETDNSLISIAMKGLPGKARARILNNMSPRLAVMIAEDMSYMGPVHMKDVEECCAKLMKILLALDEKGEIKDYDFSVLKVVIDIFDSAEKENRELRDKYSDLKSIIDGIYDN